jgi:hypothetical protein
MPGHASNRVSRTLEQHWSGSEIGSVTRQQQLLGWHTAGAQPTAERLQRLLGFGGLAAAASRASQHGLVCGAKYSPSTAAACKCRRIGSLGGQGRNAFEYWSTCCDPQAQGHGGGSEQVIHMRACKTEAGISCSTLSTDRLNCWMKSSRDTVLTRGV